MTTMVLQTVSQLPSPTSRRRGVSYREQLALVRRARLELQRDWSSLDESEKAKIVEAAERATGVSKRLRYQPISLFRGLGQMAGLALTVGHADFLAFSRDIMALYMEVLSLRESDDSRWQVDIKADIKEALSEPTGIRLKTKADVRDFFRSV